jgi:hypothetical protein
MGFDCPRHLPTQVVQITCATRDALSAFYSAYNEELYVQLAFDISTKSAPEMETTLAPFMVNVTCGPVEKTAGEVVGLPPSPPPQTNASA